MVVLWNEEYSLDMCGNATPARQLWYVNYITPFPRNVSLGSLCTDLASHVQQHNEHIRHMKFIIHVHVKKNQPILVRVL